MPASLDDRSLVRALKALADGNRFRMVQEIAGAGELSCGQLGDRFHLSQPTVSHHLKVLVDAGILEVRRDGQHHFISVNQALIDDIAALLPGRLAEPERKAKAPTAAATPGKKPSTTAKPRARARASTARTLS